MKTKQPDGLALFVVLVAFVLLSFSASVINPLYEATDELRHFRFVRHIAMNHSLPVQGQFGCSAQGHHPPLFYALGALATAWIDTGRDICYAPATNPFWGYRYWEVGVDNKNQYLHGPDESFPWRGEALAAHLVRAINVLLGAGVVWITWLIGRTIWPKQPMMALGAVAFVAFNPMFVYMAGSINNDVIAALSGSALTLASLRLLQDENGLSGKWGLILGFLFGLALLSKFNLAAVALLVEVAVSWIAWRKQQWRKWWQVNLIIAVLTLLLAGWWFWRNQILYGEPTGFQRLTELWGVRNPAASWGVAIFELPYAWTSLWGRFGYGQIPLPEPIYVGLRWTVLIAFLGLGIPFLFGDEEGHPPVRVPLLFLVLNVVLFFSVLFGYLLVSPAGPMGRFFFPALPALAILIFYGLSQWAGLAHRFSNHSLRKDTATSLTAIASNLIMATLTAVAIFIYLAAAYAKPTTFTASTPIPNPINAHFDSLVRLRGYQYSPTTLNPGETVDIDLYWEVTGQPPGDYLLFIHLLDDADTMVTQRDTHPGLGNFPSSQWRPGDRFVESIRLTLPETAYAPSSLALSVGLYAPGSYRLAITGAQGESLGDALTLGALELLPRNTDYPNPLDQNFNNEVRLIGYEYSQRRPKPGEEVTATLFWESLQQQTRDYLVEIQLLDEAGKIWTTLDDRPQLGQAPTTDWQPGQIIRDSHLLPLDVGLPPGSYIIGVALIDAQTKDAQNIIAEDGHWIDNRLLLARIRVQP